MNLLRYGLLILACGLSAWRMGAWNNEAATVGTTTIEAEFKNAVIRKYAADGDEQQLHVDRIVQFTGKSELALTNPKIRTKDFVATGDGAQFAEDQSHWSLNDNAQVRNLDGKYAMGADNISSTASEKTIIATGNAWVSSANWQAKADIIQYNQSDKTWRLEGKVHYEISSQKP